MDVSATTGLSPAVLARIRDVFGRYPEIWKAVIFGSRAKGSFPPGSDIDLAVFAPEMSQTRFAALWNELDDLPLVFTLDVVHWDTLSNACLKQRIVDEGIELMPRLAPDAAAGG